jgi:hypothetical protein
MTNQELARRADLALADLQANGGILSPEQANEFIDMVEEQPTILAQARVVRMNAPSRKINRVGFASRIMRAAVQTGGAEDDGSNDRYVLKADRSKPTTSQIQLDTKEVIAEIRIPYEALEDNIEGQSFESHIMRLIAARAALDLEEWALWADTGSGDDYLALADGWMKRMVSHVVDNANAGVSPSMFKNGMLAVPQKYLRNLSAMRHFVSKANTIRYRDLVAQRSTGYGDSMLTGQAPIFAYGAPVDSADMLGGANVGGSSKGFFTYPQNLLFGIQRQLQVETDKDIRSREIIIVLTARVAVQIDDEDATVKYINIG